MSKKFIALVVLNLVLISLLVGQEIHKWISKDSPSNQQNSGVPAPSDPSLKSAKTVATATTLLNRSDIPGDKQFHPTGLTLVINKRHSASRLFYTCQITFQFDTPALVGAHFKMRVKDSSGNYIMPDMVTGATSHSVNTYENAMLSDTVYHIGTRDNPPAGSYTFELWALAGGGTLTIVPFMSNIAVLELPSPNSP